MNVASHLFQRLLKLDPPITRDVIVQRGLRVPMPDGVDLLADRWAPRTGGDSLPVALIRTPYGRGRLLSSGMVRPLAERGFQVILQSARGTFGSGGTFEPMRNEREDGAATLEWIVKQPWFGGSIVLLGLSYMGYVQWAVAGRLPPEVKAIIPEKTDSALTLDFLRADGFSLETPFGWGILIDGQERRGGMLRALAAERKNQAALATLPLTQADVAAVGHHAPYVTDILRHDSDDPYWAAIDHRERVAEVTVPVSSIAGWYDIFLPGQLRDFRCSASRAPGAKSRRRARRSGCG
jgi:putative CocE/NonD family hydrolase